MKRNYLEKKWLRKVCDESKQMWDIKLLSGMSNRFL